MQYTCPVYCGRRDHFHKVRKGLKGELEELGMDYAELVREFLEEVVRREKAKMSLRRAAERLRGGGVGQLRGAPLDGPHILRVANVVRKRVTLGELEAGVGRRILEEAYRLLSAFVIHRGADLILETYGLALDLGITVYDGTYVAAARRTGARLLTTDNKLVSALRNRGLGLLVAR